MLQEEKPTWILSQENGVLAEARTRAFLLERFWILERSVDIEGADFIIQRRLTKMSLLDRDPPRLGFIQSKYFSSENSYQYVRKEYIVDLENKARTEFFLICHSGNENSASLYFLSANDILENFRIADENHTRKGCFILVGREILSQRYLVLDQRSVLNRLEQALKNAEFYRNRNFFSWALPSISVEDAPLKEEYLQPIDNWWGDIPKEFIEMKKSIRSALYDIEEVHDKLHAIVKSDDPETALNIAEELHYSFGNRVRIPDDLYNEDFHNVVKYHKLRYNQLKDAGLLNTHAAIRRQLTDFIISDLSPQMPLSKDQKYIINAKYDPVTLLNLKLESQIKIETDLVPKTVDIWNEDGIRDIRGILTATDGEINAYLFPGLCGYQIFKDGKHIEDPDPWDKKIVSVAEWQAVIIVEKILELRLGKI